jgi:predicted enzyme involved in methoxymalonyl-ACP biosynthesis
MIPQQRNGKYTRSLMSWLPIASDFPTDFGEALAANEIDCLEKLYFLAQHRLGYLETVQLDRALSRLALKAGSGFVAVRLAVLPSSTVDHLLPAIRVAGLRRRLMIDIHLGEYGLYAQSLLEPAPSLRQYAPQFVLLSITPRDIIASIPLTATAVESDERIARSIDELRLLWRKGRETFNAAIIQQSFLDITEPIFGSYDQLIPGAPARVISQLNKQLAEAASQEGVLLLDVTRASGRDGIDIWYDSRSWLQG